MGGLSLATFLYTIRVIIIRMTKRYFLLLSVNLLSDKPVLHPEKNLGRQFPLGSRALGRTPLAQRIRL